MTSIRPYCCVNVRSCRVSRCVLAHKHAKPCASIIVCSALARDQFTLAIVLLRIAPLANIFACRLLANLLKWVGWRWSAGQLEFGMVEENAGKNKLVQVTLRQGQTIHIPQGVPSSTNKGTYSKVTACLRINPAGSSSPCRSVHRPHTTWSLRMRPFLIPILARRLWCSSILLIGVTRLRGI